MECWGRHTVCALLLHKLTLRHHFSFFPADENIPAKILSYNRANRAVAILCNHQRAPPKTFEKSMMNLQSKVFWIWMVGGSKIKRTMSAMAITLWAGLAGGQSWVCYGRKVHTKDAWKYDSYSWLRHWISGIHCPVSIPSWKAKFNVASLKYC